MVGADSADSSAVKAFPQSFKDNHVGHQDRRRGESGARPGTTTSPGNMALGAISSPSSAYELRSICARSSAIEPNLTVPSGSLASIDPSV